MMRLRKIEQKNVFEKIDRINYRKNIRKILIYNYSIKK